MNLILIIIWIVPIYLWYDRIKQLKKEKFYIKKTKNLHDCSKFYNILEMSEMSAKDYMKHISDEELNELINKLNT